MSLPLESGDDPLADDVEFVRLARANAVDHYWLAAGDELGSSQCLLRRYRGRDAARRAVLLVHGASANSRTFLVPRGGLVRHLLEQRLDVWTLDWRASSLLSRRIQSGTRERDVGGAFSLELAAANELKTALAQIEAITGGLPISLLGHCVGGALVARALLDGTLGASPDRVVLTTLGAFFRVGVENWFKGNERVLDTAALDLGQFPSGWPAISPWAASERPEFAWPAALEDLYEIWKTTPARHGCDNPFCHRVSFMFGMPYNPNLVEAMHAIDAREAPASLESAAPEHGFWGQFGDMPVGLYIQVAQSLRHGRLARVQLERDEALRQRLSQVRLALITGSENQLWHRESIDIMFDWLQRLPPSERRVVKWVENGFGHQDLFWCEDSARRRRMYDRFLKELVPADASAPLATRGLTTTESTSSRGVPTR